MRLGTSYFGNRTVRHVAADMKQLAQDGFNLVIHTMSEYDLQFHAETMREIVAATQDAGHQVYLDPWGVGNVFGGEPYSNFVAQHPLDGCQILDDGSPGAFACPNNPLFHEYMKSWVEGAIATRADVIFWDEPHYHNASFLGGKPGRWGCRCVYCQRKYEDAFGVSMPTAETDDVKSFKMDTLRDFLGMVTGWVSEARMQNALCLAPHDAPQHVYERWMRFANLPHIAVVGTDPYWLWHNQPVDIVYEYSRAVAALCGEVGKEPQIWIQAAKIPVGRESEVAQAIDLAVKAEIRNLAVWGFEGCINESWLKCENPDAVWSIVVEAFRRLSGEIG